MITKGRFSKQEDHYGPRVGTAPTVNLGFEFGRPNTAEVHQQQPYRPGTGAPGLNQPNSSVGFKLIGE
jgi:hypothetical protein